MDDRRMMAAVALASEARMAEQARDEIADEIGVNS